MEENKSSVKNNLHALREIAHPYSHFVLYATQVAQHLIYVQTAHFVSGIYDFWQCTCVNSPVSNLIFSLFCLQKSRIGAVLCILEVWFYSHAAAARYKAIWTCLLDKYTHTPNSLTAPHNNFSERRVCDNWRMLCAKRSISSDTESDTLLNPCHAI